MKDDTKLLIFLVVMIVFSSLISLYAWFVDKDVAFFLTFVSFMLLGGFVLFFVDYVGDRWSSDEK